MSSETEETMLSQRGVLQFGRVITPVENIQIWHAPVSGYSFVISYESRDGPGLHGRPGYMASCRPTDRNRPAFKVTGSPFNTFADAERACQTILTFLAEEQ
jgi:hypothetical protein